MMGTFTFHEHTADEKFSVEAETLEDAFATAALACKTIMVGEVQPPATSQHQVSLSANKLQTLLYDFLNELVILLDAQHTLCVEATDLSIILDAEFYTLEASLAMVSADSVPFRTVIKNMTYSEMEILQEEGKVRLTVVVDI
jgi:SHS2 domain-containing protein